MKCDPSESGVNLTPENDLERSVMDRWRHQRPDIPVGFKWNYGGRLRIDFLEGDTVPPEPVPPKIRRSIRVPAVGQRVKIRMKPSGHPEWDLFGDVASIRIEGDRIRSWVKADGDSFGIPTDPDDITPIGDAPRWITIELPEEGTPPCT